MEKIHLDREKLKEVRQNCKVTSELLATLGIRVSQETAKEFKLFSPFSNEKTPSMHIQKEDGRWYCFSTKQGGGVIELVQQIKKIDCYNAGRFLLESGLSFLTEGGGNIVQETRDGVNSIPENPVRSEEKKENKPITKNLIPLLSQIGTHEQFKSRGISKKTCEYLGCGFLDPEKFEKSPLRDRIVFQVRAVKENEDGIKPVILTHIGRAVDPEQKEEKWMMYKGFQKTLELYNIDKILLDDEALSQVKSSGLLILVEGCFDVAKLVEAGIKNAVATFGSDLSIEQVNRLQFISKKTGVDKIFMFYDRDKAGFEATEKAQTLLEESGLKSDSFDWNCEFNSKKRGMLKISTEITDPCQFSVEQLQWLKEKEIL